ncbi:hypothetical protein [Aeromonas dhakensis]|uniref:hypothetical protein n=1 Tax=Aeromonas dhakensis TaxID=196024 RepID=UPI002A5269D8|nr:hypothetical protein [Aeromonas veronii]
MTVSLRRQHYAELLMTEHWFSLDSISNGNAEIIAHMLSGAICYAENHVKRECLPEEQVLLTTIIVKALLASKWPETIALVSLPFTSTNELATIAVLRYRKFVINELGGDQTPCTLQVCNDTEKLREAQHVYRVPLISRWISNVRRILRKVAILLGISKFSERDFL